MNDDDPYLLEQAIAWRLRLADTRRESSPEFEQWLAADGRHAAAWYKVQTPWEILGDHATSAEVIRLRRVALAQARISRPHPIRRVAVLGLCAAALVAAVGLGVAWQSGPHFDVYQTQAGERRTETLSDGSEITLDSNSEIRVRFSKHSRELVLTRGQALFNVAHDVLRPFSVAAGRQDIVATGTSFNVDLLERQLLVTLLEGHVIVMPHEEGTRIDMDAGEQLVIAPRGVPRITHVNVDHAVAWEKGRLVFQDEPLASVVRRVGRYSEHPITISDETTANLRISGVFHEGDVDGFVTTVVSYLPVRAERLSDGSVSLGAALSPAAP